MTWTGQSFSVGQVLTAAQMTNLQADITALANGDAGAPSIVAAAIGAAAVGTSELSTATATAAGSLGAGLHDNITLNNFALFPMFHTSTSNVYMSGHITDSTAASPRCGITNTDGSTQTYDIDHRYVTTGV